MNPEKRVEEALSVIIDLGLPRGQRNRRTALTLLALMNLTPERPWKDAQSPLMGITPIMDWCKEHYGQEWKPNTRESVRRRSIHQFIDAAICLLNPDDPKRPVNSQDTVYQIEPSLLEVLKSFGTDEYQAPLADYFKVRQSLTAKYAAERSMNMIPVTLPEGASINLSPGKHSELIKAIVEEMAPRFVPESQLVYVGDTGDKHGFFDIELLQQLGVELDSHGKFPDVVIFYPAKKWLLLCESVTSHGPVDAKRHDELKKLFGNSSAGLVFVSAFPDRKTFLKYLANIAWETEVWIADSPSHMIHFNGERFLGPYGTDGEG